MLLFVLALAVAAAGASELHPSCADGATMWSQGQYVAALQVLGHESCVGELGARVFHSPRQLSTFLQQQQQDQQETRERQNAVLNQVTLWALQPMSDDGSYLASLSDALRRARAAADAGDRVLPLAFCAAVAAWLHAASHLAASLPLVSSLEFCIAGQGQAPVPLSGRTVESACAALRVYLPPLPPLPPASAAGPRGSHRFQRITAADVEQLEQLVHVLHAPLVWAVARAHGSAECVDAVLHVEVLLTRARSLLLRAAVAVAESLTGSDDDSEKTCVGSCDDDHHLAAAAAAAAAGTDAVNRVLDRDEVLDFASDLAQEMFLNGFIFSDLSEATAQDEEYMWRQLNATLTGEPFALDCSEAPVDASRSAPEVVPCLATSNSRSNPNVAAQTFQDAAGDFEGRERFLLSVLACFHPLSTIGGKVAKHVAEEAESVAMMMRTFGISNVSPFQKLLHMSLLETADERELRDAIRLQAQESGSEVPTDSVAQRYEAHPYPRWDNIYDCIRSTQVCAVPPLLPRAAAAAAAAAAVATGDSVAVAGPERVLVAGCGTGRFALQLAASRPSAQFVLLDQSAASLAYAKRKAIELLGVQDTSERISFVQGDLLALSVKDHGSFDLVVCNGVLHHLDDPSAGLAALRRVLRNESTAQMRLALYSRRAREHLGVFAGHAWISRLSDSVFDPVVAIRRAVIRYRLYNDDSDLSVAAVAPIADGDFFSRDAVLDLLFHPRERSYAVPEIVNFLEAADLRISAFDTDPQVQLAFQQWVQSQSKEDVSRLSQTELVDGFEADNPGAFGAMFQFWAKPVSV